MYPQSSHYTFVLFIFANTVHTTALPQVLELVVMISTATRERARHATHTRLCKTTTEEEGKKGGSVGRPETELK